MTVGSILSNEEDYLCSFPKNRHILIENIPYRLSSFNHTLSLQEAFTVLSAVFSGYNTLNYVYGPLFTNEEMIGFN